LVAHTYPGKSTRGTGMRMFCSKHKSSAGFKKGARPKPTPSPIRQRDVRRMDRCNHCKQELIEIDNRGEQLTGCLSCNLWSASGEKLWITLSKEDLNALALHHLRQGGSAKQMPKPHRSS
jgi:hypothetical protein